MKRAKLEFGYFENINCTLETTFCLLTHFIKDQNKYSCKSLGVSLVDEVHIKIGKLNGITLNQANEGS